MRLRPRRLPPVPLRAISRVDRRGEHGWRVHIKRRGKDHVWLFPDHEYGGRARAHTAAQAWLGHALLLKLPPPLCTSSHDVRNTTGEIGVSLLELVRPSGAVYLAYRAVWPLTNGRYKKRAFSVSKYGKRTALQLAVQARKQGVAQLAKKLRERIRLELLKRPAHSARR